MQRVSVRVALRGALVAVASALLGAVSVWGYPAKGAQAPALDSLKLLQSPEGARADWASLKGKVVVLEFWATWRSFPLVSIRPGKKGLRPEVTRELRCVCCIEEGCRDRFGGQTLIPSPVPNSEGPGTPATSGQVQSGLCAVYDRLRQFRGE